MHLWGALEFGDLVEVSDEGEVTSGRVDLVHFSIADEERFTAELYDLNADSSGGPIPGPLRNYRTSSTSLPCRCRPSLTRCASAASASL